MAFGFDAGIILSGRPADPVGNARSMASLLQQQQATRIQQTEHQQTLAGLLRKQEQEQRLREIYSKNAGNPEALATALAGGGFGQEAMGWTQVKAREEAARQAYMAGLQRQALDAERLAETQRHNREMEKRPPGSPPLTIITGADGTYHLVNPRQPGAPAVPVMDAQGNPVVKPKPARAPKVVNQGDRDRLEALHVQVREADDLLSRFKDDFAGKGVAGGAVVATEQILGSWAPESAQEEAAWWADFGKMVDLPERNATFGASLTDTEKQSWENAKNIKPGASPKVIRAQLAKMKRIAQEAARRRGRSLVKDGYSADAIEEFTGPLGLEAPAAPPAALSPEEARELAELEAEGF